MPPGCGEGVVAVCEHCMLAKPWWWPTVDVANSGRFTKLEQRWIVCRDASPAPHADEASCEEATAHTQHSEWCTGTPSIKQLGSARTAHALKVIKMHLPMPLPLPDPELAQATRVRIVLAAAAPNKPAMRYGTAHSHWCTTAWASRASTFQGESIVCARKGS